MERCNRLLAVVTDAVDLEHSLPKYKLLTGRRIFHSFSTEGIYCLLFPKSQLSYIPLCLNLQLLPRLFPLGIFRIYLSYTRFTSWSTNNLALIILFQVIAHSSLPSSWCHLALGSLLTHIRQCKWLLAVYQSSRPTQQNTCIMLSTQEPDA